MLMSQFLIVTELDGGESLCAAFCLYGQISCKGRSWSESSFVRRVACPQQGRQLFVPISTVNCIFKFTLLLSDRNDDTVDLLYGIEGSSMYLIQRDGSCLRTGWRSSAHRPRRGFNDRQQWRTHWCAIFLIEIRQMVSIAYARELVFQYRRHLYV